MNDTRKQEILDIVAVYINRYTAAQFCDRTADIERYSEEANNWMLEQKSAHGIKNKEIKEALKVLETKALKEHQPFAYNTDALIDESEYETRKYKIVDKLGILYNTFTHPDGGEFNIETDEETALMVLKALCKSHGIDEKTVDLSVIREDSMGNNAPLRLVIVEDDEGNQLTMEPIKTKDNTNNQ